MVIGWSPTGQGFEKENKIKSVGDEVSKEDIGNSNLRIEDYIKKVQIESRENYHVGDSEEGKLHWFFLEPKAGKRNAHYVVNKHDDAQPHNIVFVPTHVKHVGK